MKAAHSHKEGKDQSHRKYTGHEPSRKQSDANNLMILHTKKMKA